jgi:tRNA/tmRNA/rRNA uracil-C5-methylase (TrmA/RlmC/RlmD family)
VTDAGKAAVTQSGAGFNAEHVQMLADHAKSVLKGYYREYLLDRMVTVGLTDCGHNAYRSGTVLDPFSGSGTTGLAAAKHGRRYVGIDLSSDYLDLSLRTRLAQASLLDGEPA